MWCNSKSIMLLLTTLLFTLKTVSALIPSNSTALARMQPDDIFYDMPVYYQSNTPIRQFLSKQQMKRHIEEILKPLEKFIVNEDRRIAVRRKRQDGGQFLPALLPPPTIVQVEEYKFGFIASAQIGDYNFSCQQSNGDLIIYNPTFPVETQTRSVPVFTEFQLHPRPGVWWWVICVTFESGGAGMGVTGAQNPGGDKGIDPNALKSLVG
ncbi:uncharacterized protein LOC116336581 [Contarinia nasturtii]|uniref:uncharacterized protein LOC116336581 n=1 Tax=Contarinia nasturtii TaxID=265458 RepID=UPI0012D423A7|nr:uncharacterized protein LOC116336581 [Contarinia nasturtii]